MNDWHFYPWFHIPTLFSCLLALWLAWLSWRRRPIAGALPTTIGMIAGALWSLGVFFEHASPNMAMKLWWVKVQYPGIACISICWFALVFDYLGYHRWFTRRNVILLSIIPCFAVVMNWTNEYHGAIYAQSWIEHFHGIPMLAVRHGWAFYIFVVYVYLFNLLAFIFCLHAVFTSTVVYRYQALVLLAAAIAPFTINVLYNIGRSPIPFLDLTPFAFSLSAAMLIWGYQRHQLWALSPVAQQNLMQSLPDGILVLDARQVIISVNPAASRILQRVENGLIGEKSTDIIAWLDSMNLSALTPVEIQQNVTISVDPLTVYDVHITPLASRQHAPCGWLVLIRDISERCRLEKRLQELAYYDPLTGLPNRRAGEDILLRALTRGRRQSTRTAVLYLDLDHFKEINDRWGHHIGDAVLKQAGYRLARAVRTTDTVSRFGGDEFVLILPDIADVLPQDTADRIHSAFTEPMVIADLVLNITLSIGIAVAPDDGDSVDELLVHSDTRMYIAKRAGTGAARPDAQSEAQPLLSSSVHVPRRKPDNDSTTVSSAH